LHKNRVRKFSTHKYADVASVREYYKLLLTDGAPFFPEAINSNDKAQSRKKREESQIECLSRMKWTYVPGHLYRF
jgi:hypothetical protein